MLAYCNILTARVIKFKNKLTDNNLESIIVIGNLQSTWTCPPDQKHFPLLIGGDDKCNMKTYLTGIDIDGFGNSLITHFVQHTQYNECLWTDKGRQVQGNYSYIVKLDQYGDVQWKHSSNYTNYIIQNPVIAGSFVFTSLKYLQGFRIIKLNYSTGDQLDDRNFTKYTPTLNKDSTTFLQIQADQSTLGLYIYVDISSSYFSKLGLDPTLGISAGMIIKLDNDLNILWWKMINTTISGTVYRPQDLKIGGACLWALSIHLTNNQSLNLHLAQIDKSNGLFLQDQIYQNSVAIQSLKMCLDEGESKWAIAFYDESNTLNLLIGFALDMSIISHYQKSLALNYYNFHFTRSGLLLMSWVYEMQKVQVLILDPANGKITNQQMYFQNFTADLQNKMFTALRDEQYFIAFQNPNLYPDFASTFKVLICQIDFLDNDNQNTSTSVRVNVFEVIETEMDRVYFSLNKILVMSNHTMKLFGLQSCHYNYTTTVPEEMKINQGNSYFEFTGIDCRNKNLVLKECLYLNRSVSKEIYLFYPSKFPNNMTFVLRQLELQGSRVVYISFLTEGKRVNVPLRVITNIPNKWPIDPRVLSGDPCIDKIFPFYFGQTTELQMLHITTDQYSNFIMTGFAINNAYSSDNLQYRGFIQLMNEKGSRQWLYKITSSIDNYQESRCYSAMLWQSFITLICTAFNIATSNYAPFLIRLEHIYGTYIFSRWLPTDLINPAQQIPISVQNYYSYRTVITYSYQKGSEKGLASFSFYNEDEIVVEWMKYYPSPEANYFLDFIQDFEKEQQFIVKHIPAQYCLVTRVDSTTGKIAGQVKLIQGAADGEGHGSTFGIMNIIIPFLENSSPQKIHIYILDKVDLTTVKSAKITLTAATILRSVATNDDSLGNIYAAGGGDQLFFAKFNSDFSTYTYKIFKDDMDGSLSINQIISNQDTQFYVFLGKYMKTEKPSTIIFKGDDKVYNCFSPSDLLASDTAWYPSLQVLNTPIVNITNFIQEIELLVPIVGTNKFDIDLIFPKTFIRYYTYTYTGSYSDIADIANGVFNNQFQEYPNNGQKCSMLAGQKNLVGIPQKRIVPVIEANYRFDTLQHYNCQGMKFMRQVLDPLTNTTQFRIPLTYYSVPFTQLFVDAGVYIPYRTFFVNIRYYDQNKGLQAGYQDNYMFQQIFDVYYQQKKQTIDPATPNYCTQTPFPYLFGGTNSGDGFKTLAMFATADEKIYLGGNVDNYLNPIFSNEDVMDAFIMKISSAGYVYWVNQLYSIKNEYDQISAITYTNQSVYAFYSTPQVLIPKNIITCIIKLNYIDGQTYWMKNLIIANKFAGGMLYIKEANDLVVDHKPQSFQFVLSFMGYWNDVNAQYPGNIFFQDNSIDQGPSSQYTQLFYPIAMPTSKPFHGQTIFDNDTNHVYVTQQGYFSSNTIEDLIVLKQDPVTGTVVWSRIYNMNNPSISGTTRGFPVLAQNKVTKDIYVAQIGGYSHLVKIKNDGTTLKRVYAKTSQTSTVISINILIDQKREQVTVVSLTGNLGTLEVITLDSNFNMVSNLYKEFSKITSAPLRFTIQIYDYYYITYNIIDMGNNFGQSNTLISKKSINAEEYGRHQCLQMDDALNQFNLLYTFPINDISIPPSILLSFTQPLLVIDSFAMIALQLEDLIFQKLLPRPFPIASYIFQTSDSAIQSTCQYYSGGLSPSQQYDPFYFNSPITASLQVLSQGRFRNCYYEYATYTSDLDLIPGNQLLKAQIFTSDSLQLQTLGIFAFYRNLQINNPCLKRDPTQCQDYAVWPLIVNQDNNKMIPNQTIPAVTCYGSYNYPKILNVTAPGIEDITVKLRGIDVHDETGNYLMCGQINKNVNQEFPSNQYTGFIQLADLNGKIYWFDTHTSILSAIDSQYIGCFFSKNETFQIFSVYHQSNNQLGIISQNYSTGDMQYMKKITGLYPYSATNEIQVFQDKADNNLYITGQRMDIIAEQWVNFILSIDISNIEIAVQRYWSYLAYSGAAQATDQIFHLDFSQVNDFMYSLSTVTLSGVKKVQVTQYKKTYGKYLLSMHHSFDTSQKRLHIDSSSQIYLTIGSVEGTNTYFIRTLLQYNQNLVLIQGKDLKIQLSFKQGFYESDLISDSVYLYEFFHFQGKYFFVTKVLKSNLSVQRLQMHTNSGATASSLARIINWTDKLFIFFQSNRFSCNYTNQCLQIQLATLPNESIVNLLDQDFTHDVSCVQYVDQTINQQSYSISLQDQSSGITQNLFQGDYRLSGLMNTYMEKITSGFTYIKFHQAKLLGCPNIANIYSIPRQNQWIYPTGFPYTTSLVFGMIQNCVGAIGSYNINVDQFDRNPSGISFQVPNATTLIYSINITKTQDYGTYVYFEQYNGSDFFISQSRTIFEIYPANDYESLITRLTCAETIYPAIFGIQGYIPQHMEYHQTKDNLLICGKTYSILSASSLNGAFISLYTTSFQLIYHLFVQPHANSNIVAKYCSVGNDNNIYSIVHKESSLSLSPQDYHYKTFLFQHAYNGKFIAAKQFQIDWIRHTVDFQQLDPSSGDIFLMGEIIQLASYPLIKVDGYFIRINKSFNILKYIKFNDNVGSNYMQTHGLALDMTNQYAYIISSGQHASPYPYLMSFSKISYNDGSKQWSKYFKHTNSVYEIQRRSSTSYQKFSLALIGSYLYSCIVVQSNLNQEIFVGKHNPSDGSIISRVEMLRSGVTNNGCILHYHQSSNNILMAYGDYGNMNIVAFSPSSFTFKANQITFSNTTADFQHYIFSSTASIVYMLAVSTTTQIISRIIDFTNFVLQDNCQINSASTSWQAALTMPNGYLDDMSQYYQNNPDFTSSLQPAADLQQHFTEPQQFRIYVNLTFDILKQPRIQIGDCKPAALPVIPFVPSRTGLRISDTLGGFLVSINASVSIGLITQCSGMMLNYTFLTTPTAGIQCFNYDLVTQMIIITPTNNKCAGSFDIQIKAFAFYFPDAYALSNVFKFDIERNYAPTVVLNFTTTVTMFAHHNYTWDVYIDFDKEGDIPSASVTVLDISLNPVIFAQPWFTYTNIGQKQIQVKAVNAPQPPTGLDTITYKIQLSVSDSFNIDDPSIYYIDLTINRNMPPYAIVPIELIIPQIMIPQSFTHTFWYDNFEDIEGDQFYISCTKSTLDALNPNWIKIEQNKTQPGNVTIYGTCPSLNTYIGNYKITCKVQDLDTITFLTLDFTLEVVAKQPIQILNPQIDQIVLIPQSAEIIYNLYDSSGVITISTLYVNSVLYNANALSGKIDWYPLIPKIVIQATSNANIGTYYLEVKFQDNILAPIWNRFTAEIRINLPPYSVKGLKDRYVIANNKFQVEIDISDVFKDPEELELTRVIRYSGGGSLPYFVSQIFNNGTIRGYTTDSDVGNYQFEGAVFDNANQIAVEPFVFSIKACYYKCLNCWDADYNTCSNCKDGFFFFNNECLEQCVSGSYGNATLNQCIECPFQCRTCFGSDSNTQCNDCNEGFFKLNFGCFKQCPDGYFGDKSDKTCKKCNRACSTCYGPSYAQCYICAELIEMNQFGQLARIGYAFSSGSECKIPICNSGEYFYWYPEKIGNQYLGYCKQCYKTCLTCIGGEYNDCILCQQGHIYNAEAHTCTRCEDITGMFTNEEEICEDKCGDGLVIDKQCDDGNTISGDGCSNKCVLEFGFDCPKLNSPCKEIIPPKFKIEYVSASNIVYLQFSEYVYIQNETDLQKQNFVILMNSENGGSPYVFDYRIIEDPNQRLIPNRSISKFMIKIQDIKQTILGSEILMITFKNFTKILDTTGNELRNIAQITNPSPSIYLSDAERMIIINGGKSIKYAFLSVCSFNLALRILLNSTMQFLWGLVHSLQIFTLLLYIDIEFPENVLLFSDYMQVASGNVDEFNGFIPNLSDYIIDKDKIQEPDDDYQLYYKFKNDEISPYFLISYGPKLTLWAVGLLVILPSALLLNKIFKNVQIWDDMIGQFFFNGPLRAVIEMYIELVIQVVLNTQFLKMRNTTMIVASGLAFIFGIFAVIFPFLIMTVIYHNRREIKKNWWDAKFGMLTYEINKDSILQLYYYSIFLYQRLVIAVTIVYGVHFTLLQCAMILACNLGMIFYLIKQKPFKNESQQTTIILDEISVTICLFVFMVIDIQQVKGDQLKNMGYIILVFIVLSVFKNFGIVIYFGMKLAKLKIKQMFKTDDQQIDSLDSSLDTNEDGSQTDQSQRINTVQIMDEIIQENLENEFYQSFYLESKNSKNILTQSPIQTNRVDNDFDQMNQGFIQTDIDQNTLQVPKKRIKRIRTPRSLK